LILIVIFGLRGDYRVSDGNLIEFFCVAAVLTGMAIWRHRTNIKRLLSGTENKLWGNKK
jgi:glycerol-3-phosphate acyltransferase PlsY